MGILNVTPDSFSDGGRYFNHSSAVDHALRMIEDGADIIDVGGESTRPGSDQIPPEEEIRRTIPVIEKLAKLVSVPVSIDTYKSAVAERAVEAGASIVNDISAMTFDRKMPEVVSKYNVPVILMHMKGSPKTMQDNPSYDALMPELIDYFRSKIAHAVQSGIPRELIIIDPGIGFGKTFDHNLQIINNLHEFKQIGQPLLIGLSRKAFIGKILDNAPSAERIEGTAAAVAVSISKGAHIIRVHDVRGMSRVAKVADAINRESIVH